jgi:hypothetical protein
MWSSRSANRINQGLAENAEDTMRRILERAGVTGLEDPQDHPARNRWLWEAAIILIGATLVTFILFASPD